MPSLVLFGERSVVGGDDLQPISLAAILVRGLQTILLLPPVLLLVIVIFNQFLLITTDPFIK